MKLTHEQSTFFLKCDFHSRAIAREAGFRWSTMHNLWFTENPSVAARLREHATPETKAYLNSLCVMISPWTGSPPKSATPLLPNQEVGVKFLLERNRAYFAADPGLGKTGVAAVVASALFKEFGWATTYICPPFLLKNVKNEFKKFAPHLHVTGHKEMANEVLIYPDSLLLREGAMQMMSERGGVLFVDEGHRFNHETSKRTQAMFGTKNKRSAGKLKEPERKGIVDQFERVYFLSGTPMTSRPRELYPVLSKLAPETIDHMNFFQYGRRYCAGYENEHGWDFSGASNVDELARRVIHPGGPFMLRQRKKLLNLPPKTEEVFVLSADMSKRLTTMDAQLRDRYDSTDDLMKASIADSIGKSTDELHVATYRRLLGQEKVKAVSEYIDAILSSGDESVLLFALHTDVVASLAEELEKWKPFVITGKTKMSERQAQVDEFQNCGEKRRLFIGNIQAMGVGFTLTKATRVVFAEYSWVPGENEQASDRAHRIGQGESVLVQYMIFENSIDKGVIETVLRKRRTIEKLDQQ